MAKKHIVGLIVGSIALIIAVALIILWCTGVFSNSSQKPVKANELYTELNSLPQKIEVEMAGEYVGNFTVEEPEKIEQIYSLIMSTDYHYSKESIPPGININIKFIYSGSNAVYLSSRSIIYDGRQYLAESYQKLNNLLISMGIDSGLISER